MSTSRTKNVSKNALVGLVCQFINLLATFIGRTFFIRILGNEYLGVNGLFTNILTILSFAELGIGNAIVFNMYKPLAIGDEKHISSLMTLYRKAYIIIGIIVAFVGLAVTPFLNIIIKNPPNISDNISILYILFLANTVTSYFFAYKKSILIADQKNYITILVTEVVHIIQIVLQIVFLMITHNYIIYLLIQILCTFFDNFITSLIANKKYPFLKKESEMLPKEESRKIFKNVKSLALYKFGSVILNGTDNIIVSAMIGVVEVGLVSNYVLIITACSSLLNKITDSFIASVGNLNAVSNREKQYNVFNKIFFITAWVYGFASIGLITVFSSFINAWIGDQYLLGTIVVIALVSEFYVKGAHSASYTFRTTLGFFNEGKWSALLAALLNIVLSIILCHYIGLAGVFIATPISRILSIGIVDPVLIFKKGFNKNPLGYYLKYIAYLALFIALGFLCSWVISFVEISGWLGVIIKIIVVTLVFNAIMIIIFSPTKMFRDLFKTLIGVFKK